MRDINVMQLNPLTTPQGSGEVYFNLTGRPQPTTGMRQLMQIVALTLLKTKGADAYAPNEGAGLGAFLEKAGAKFTKKELSSRITIIARECEQQVKRNQEELTDIPLEERIRYLTFIDIVEDDIDKTKWRVLMELANEAGETQSIDI